MKTKLFKTLSLVALTTMVIASCIRPNPYGDPAVSASPTSLSFDVNGGSNTVSLKATVKWTASPSQSWVSVSPSSEGPSVDMQTVTITVSANDGLERSAEVVFQSEDQTLKSVVSISQAAYMPSDVKEPTVAQFNSSLDAYKYQKFRLAGVVKSLQSNGAFTLKDDTGLVPVAGLNASEQPYGTEGGKLSNVAERDYVTVVGYLVAEGTKATLKYAYLEKVDPYTEPDPSQVAVNTFPCTFNFLTSNHNAVVNNPVFPYDLEQIWSWSDLGWVASGYKGSSSYTTESRLYTEKIDMKEATKPVLTFEHRLTNFKDYLTARTEVSVWISADGGEWTKLPVSSYSFPYEDEYAKGDVIPSESISLEKYIGKTIQLMFQYTSSAESEAGTWELRNVSVKVDEVPEQPDNSNGTEDYNKPEWDWNK